MSDLVTSCIRTVVPAIVGSLMAWLSTKGIDLDVEAATGLTTFLAALFSGLYYLAARMLEQAYPEFGRLLGVAKKPKY